MKKIYFKMMALMASAMMCLGVYAQDAIEPTIISPTIAVGEAYTSVEALKDAHFAITAEGKALYGSDNQNAAFNDYAQAFKSTNSGYQWRLLEVNAESSYYQLQLVTPDGKDYAIWGNPVGVLNSQAATGWCSFILNTNQDIADGSTYEILYVEGQGFTLKNVGTGLYQGADAAPANKENPTYFTLAPVSSTYVPALEAMLAEGESWKAIISDAEAVAAYDAAIAGIDPATTEDALADAKKVDAAISELAKAQTAAAGVSFTRAIVNPSFELGDRTGWEENYGGNTSGTNNFGKKTGSIFLERWTSSANGGKLSDGYIKQTVTGLPNGYYTLTAEMQNLEQANDPATDGKGYYLVANDDSTEVAVAGETVKVTTNVTDGTITIAAAIKGCTGNWVCVDNFQLTYEGTILKDAWYKEGAFAIVGHDFVEGVKKEFVEPRWVADAEGNAYLEVTSNDNPSQEWDSQIFITLNDELKVGDKVNFSMLVRGTAEGVMSTQTHSAPGSYVGGLWPDINVTTEWTKYENVYTVSNATAKTLVFNLAKAATANNFQFDDIAISIEKAPEFEWVDIIKNGDMEGTDTSCFYKTEATVGPSIAAITAGAGKDGSAGIEVQSADSPTNPWDTQFFIRLPYILPTGTHFLVEFDIKADKAANSTTQGHTEPGSYKGGGMGNPQFTTEWATYSYEGTISADGTYSIAINLAESAAATKYSFDNIKFFVQDNVLPELTASPDLSKKEFSIDVERYPGQGYGAQQAEADIAAIKSFLGVEALTAEMLSIVNPDGTTISDYAPYDGWFAADGTAKTWGDLNAADAPAAGVCVKFFQILETAGSFDICDMNGADVVGTTYTVKYALTANGKTAIYAINVKFVEKPVIYLADYTAKAETVELKIAAQDAEGNWAAESATEAINVADITALVGENYVVYGVGAKDGDKETLTNSYSCDPHPGFWCLADGTADIWANSTFGVSFYAAEGVFKTWTKAAVTEDLSTTFYFVNEEAKEYVAYKVVLCAPVAEEPEIGTVIHTIDFATQESYPYYVMTAPEGSSFDVIDGALVIENTVEQANFWDLQPFVCDWFSLKAGYDYIVRITMKADTDGSATIGMGTWSASMSKQLEFTAGTEYQKYNVEFPASTVESANNDVHVLFQAGKYVGKVEIAKVEIIEIVPVAIESVETAAPAAQKNGKYMENGKLVIIKNGKKFNAAGQAIK